MLQVLLRALSFFAIIVIGNLLKTKHIVSPDAHRIVGNLVICVTLPCTIVNGFHDSRLDFSLFWLMLLAFSVNIALMGVGLFLARNDSPQTKAFNVINYPSFNIGCFTLPFVQSFMSQTGIIATCLFDSGSSLLSGGGTYAVACCFQKDGKPLTRWEFCKKLLTSPPLMTYVVMIALSLLDFRLPEWLFTLITPAAGANAFLSMLMIGLSLHLTFPIPNVGKLLRHLLVRYGFCLAVGVAFYFLAPLSLEIRRTACLLLLSPLASLSPVYTERIHGDYETSALLASLTIVISLAAITSLLMIWNY